MIGLLVSLLAFSSTVHGQTWTDQTRSVIASSKTFFAPQLPSTLKIPHFAPDPGHPNLRLWFSPDSFEQDNTADSAPVTVWRNLARIGIDVNNVQTQSANPQQTEVLRQPSYSLQPIFKKNVLNGRGVVRFARTDSFGLSGQRLELYQNSTTTVKGFVSSGSNPFANTSEWTLFIVTRSTQAIGDQGLMGILSATQSADNVTDDRGFHIFKTCSTCVNTAGINGGTAPACFPGKYSRFSSIGFSYGATGPLSGAQIDDNSCSDVCSNGCGTDNIPSTCSAKWGPVGKRKLQDPDKAFRIVTARAIRFNSTMLQVSMYVDGFHASAQPPGFITGNSTANTYAINDPGVTAASINSIILGGKPKGEGSVEHLSGDIAEIMIYNKPLTIPEMDRIGNYLSRKYALSGYRLDDNFTSPTRSSPVSCTTCDSLGPVGEAGVTHDNHLSAGDAFSTGFVGTPNTVNFTFANISSNFTIFNVSSSLTSSDLVDRIFTVCNGSCFASNAVVKGSGKVLTATSSADSWSITVSSSLYGVIAWDMYFFSGKEICAEDVGMVSVVTDTTHIRLSGLFSTQPTGINALVGMYVSVCMGHCTRGSDARVANLRGAAEILSSTGQDATLATAISGVAVGDSYVLYNAHKVRLHQTTSSLGIAATSAVPNFYSFTGHHIYFKPGGRCALRGARVVSYSTGLRCAVLGSSFEVGDYYVNGTAVARADMASDGACRGALCDGPDTGGIGGAASGHVSSIRMTGGALTGCTAGTTLTIAGDSSGFLATVGSVSSGSISSITIINHGSGLKAGSLVAGHGNRVGVVTNGSIFVLASGSGAPTADNALVGKTVVVCSGVCAITVSSVTNVRGGGLIIASTQGAQPLVTVGANVLGVQADDEYFFAPGPLVVASSFGCLCQGLSFSNTTDAYRSLPCLSALVGAWSDGQDGCAVGHYRKYLLVKDGNTRAVTKSNYLQGINTIATESASNSGPAIGGSEFIAKGAFLYPNDVHVSQAPSVTNVQLATGTDILLNSLFLRVTFGRKCSTNPNADNYCLTSSSELDATGCMLYNYPRGYDPAGQGLTTVTDFARISDLPEIRCVAPAGAGSERSVNFYWHGIPLTLSAWWRYSGPVVRAVKPSPVAYTGGDIITISGSNFGPFGVWSRAGSKAVVELTGRSAVGCQNTQWISDGQLVCTVPPLPAMKQALDAVQHTVSVQVVVRLEDASSDQGPASTLVYKGVPAYYGCDNGRSTTGELCFSCCRSACIVDAFAEGGAQGTATLGNCDAACYTYCSYTPPAA